MSQNSHTNRVLSDDGKTHNRRNPGQDLVENPIRRNQPIADSHQQPALSITAELSNHSGNGRDATHEQQQQHQPIHEQEHESEHASIPAGSIGGHDIMSENIELQR